MSITIPNENDYTEANDIENVNDVHSEKEKISVSRLSAASHSNEIEEDQSFDSENESGESVDDVENDEIPETVPLDKLMSIKMEHVGSKSNSGRNYELKIKPSGPIDMTPPEVLLEYAEKRRQKCYELKKMKRCIYESNRCVALVRIINGDNHWKLAEAYINLSQAYLYLRNLSKQAQEYAEMAKNIILISTSNSDEKPKISELIITIYYTLGLCYFNLKMYKKAEQYLLKSESVCNEWSKFASVDSDNIDLTEIKILTTIAKVMAKQRTFDKSRQYFDKVIELIERQHGKKCAQLIPIYQEFGKMEQTAVSLSNDLSTDNFEKAIEFFLLANDLAHDLFPSGSIEIADASHLLARAYSEAAIATNDGYADTSAESYFNDCLAIYQSILGSSDKKTLSVQDDLVKLMLRSDRNEDALNILKNNIKEKIEIHGECSSEVADTYHLIGSIHLANSQFEKALKSFKKCQELQLIIFGANNRKTKETQIILDGLIANPQIAKKQTKTDMSKRPGFSAVSRSSSKVGGFRNTWS